MKSIYKTIFLGLLTCIFLASCEEEDERVVFPHSTPVIESVSVNPTSFAYGDSVTITAKVSDPATPLSTMEVKMIVNDVLIANTSFRTPGNSAEVTHKFKIAYTAELPENADVNVMLSLINAEGDKTEGTIPGLKGKRTYYDKLYLVLENGEVITLTSQGPNSDKYEADDILIKANKINYRIAQKLTDENLIDFTGHVWGSQNDGVQVIDETGDYILSTNTAVDYITGIVFDTYSFSTTLIGDNYNPNDLVLDTFSDVNANGEAFKKQTRSFVKNQELTLFGDFADMDIVFNMDYFERPDVDHVKFIGDAGSYDVYYSESRKIVIIDPAERAYPNILLAAGVGLGYPSKINQTAHTQWNFDAPLGPIVFRRIANDTYQATVYYDVKNSNPEELSPNFKFYENKDWGNEKGSTDYTMPSILAKDTDWGKTDGNWYVSTTATSGVYKITINLGTKVVTAESVTLP